MLLRRPTPTLAARRREQMPRSKADDHRRMERGTCGGIWSNRGDPHQTPPQVQAPADRQQAFDRKLRWQSRPPGRVQLHRRQRTVGSTVTGRMPTAQSSKREQQEVRGTCDRRRWPGRWETPCGCSDQARKGCSTDWCTGRRHQPSGVTPRLWLAPYMHQLPEPRRRIRAPTREHKRGQIGRAHV